MSDSPRSGCAPRTNATVSLTYDVTSTLPLARILQDLDEFGLRGTFYVYPPTAVEFVLLLKTAVIAGHEIGNGALFGLADSNGVVVFTDPDVVNAELAECEAFIREVLGDERAHSLAFPSLSGPVGPDGMIARLTQHANTVTLLESAWKGFCGVRGVEPGTNPLGGILPEVPLRTMKIPEENPRSALSEIEDALRSHAWTVVSFLITRETTAPGVLAFHREVCERLSSTPHTLRLIAEVFAEFHQVSEGH